MGWPGHCDWRSLRLPMRQTGVDENIDMVQCKSNFHAHRPAWVDTGMTFLYY